MKIRSWLAKQKRAFILNHSEKLSPQKLQKLAVKRRQKALIKARNNSNAYKELLEEAGINSPIYELTESLWKQLPVLSKENTFQRFELHDLLGECQPEELGTVLTSSGISGYHAFGVSTHQQVCRSHHEIDLALEQTFHVDEKRTLIINTLPMGVRFNSRTTTIADTSVREDMAFAVLSKFEKYYDQVILVSDPLFLNRLLEYAREKNYHWPRNKVNCVIGEEAFNEHFRNYVAAEINADLDLRDGPMIASSMGVGELGLNLFFETRETIALKRLLHNAPSFFEELFGFPYNQGSMMLFCYNPLRTYVEALQPDDKHIGDLLVSVLKSDQALPLLRYRTGDRIRLLDWPDIQDALQANNLPLLDKPPLPLIALAGRENDILVERVNISRIKDLLFLDHSIARQLTGAWRLIPSEQAWDLNIQLTKTGALSEDELAFLEGIMPIPCRVKAWPYYDFPFGLKLDYERKFSYLGESERVVYETVS